MAKIGWGEFAVILIIALLVLGPDKLPQAGRMLGRAVRSVKKFVHEATRELDEIDDFREIKRDVEGIQKDLRSMGSDLERSVQEDAEKVEKDIRRTEKELTAAVEKEPEEDRCPDERTEEEINEEDTDS